MFFLCSFFFSKLGPLNSLKRRKETSRLGFFFLLQAVLDSQTLLAWGLQIWVSFQHGPESQKMGIVGDSHFPNQYKITPYLEQQSPVDTQTQQSTFLLRSCYIHTTHPMTEYSVKKNPTLWYLHCLFRGCFSTCWSSLY